MTPTIAPPTVDSPKSARISAKRGASAFAVTAFSGALLAPVPAAFAAQDDPCPVGTEGIAVSVPGLDPDLSVCEVQFTDHGNHTWTPPAGVEVTAVEALLVGGGGGGTSVDGLGGYAGGGGDVKLVSLIPGEEVEIVVGKGGDGIIDDDEDGEDGTASTVLQPGTPNPLESAQGGEGGGEDGGGGDSGNSSFFGSGMGGGGGAGGPANDEAGGPGLRVSDLLDDSDYEGPGLFAGVTTGYGGGGSLAFEVSPGPNLDEPERDFGGGTATAEDAGSGAFSNPVLIEARPNSGGGGGAAYYEASRLTDRDDGFFVGGNGADGIVIIRFAYITPEPEEVITEPEEETTEEVAREKAATAEAAVQATEPELPRTGGSALLGMLGAGAVLAGLGGGLTYLSRRRTL